MGRSNKAAKEAFVSNLNGGTALEVNEVTLVAAVSASKRYAANEDTVMLIPCK